MQLLADSAVLTVAILHIVFMVLEMLFWNRPVGHKIFGLKPDFADRTRALAANQGLYNGFLAAGLIWSLMAEQYAINLQVFFLGCMVIAGIFGGITARLHIIWIQALPAAIALILVFLAQSTY